MSNKGCIAALCGMAVTELSLCLSLGLGLDGGCDVDRCPVLGWVVAGVVVTVAVLCSQKTTQRKAHETC